MFVFQQKNVLSSLILEKNVYISFEADAKKTLYNHQKIKEVLFYNTQ